MPYGFVRIFIFFLLLLPPPRFPDDNFWPPSRTAPEFKPFTGHGHRKKCIVFQPRATPGWGRGAPQTPQNPPPPPEKKNLHALYIVASVSDISWVVWEKWHTKYHPSDTNAVTDRCTDRCMRWLLYISLQGHPRILRIFLHIKACPCTSTISTVDYNIIDIRINLCHSVTQQQCNNNSRACSLQLRNKSVSKELNRDLGCC